MKSISQYLLSAFALAFLAAACGGSGIVTNPGQATDDDGGPVGENPMTTAASFANATPNLNVFSLGADFPPDMQIPDIAGMESTAFVVSFFPVGVLAIDLSANPPVLSTAFKGLDATGITEVSFPGDVLILDAQRAFLIGTSDFAGTSGITYFNPTTGAVKQTISLSTPITLTQPLPYSRPADCDGGGTETVIPAGPYAPNFAEDIAFANGRLFVSMSNACFDADGSVYSQGLVRIYDLNPSMPFLTPAATPFLLVAGFNTSALTVSDGSVIATSTGDTNLSGGISTPESDSFLTKIDPEALDTAGQLNLGRVGANFQPLALTSDGRRGFVASSTFSEIYEIDMEKFKVVHGAANPISVSGNDADFMTDQEVAFGDQVLFVSSFNTSSVRAVDLSGTGAEVLPNLLNYAFEGNPGVTGASALSLRPGQPGVDFTGPDLWVMTASPGTLSNARTY